MDFEVEDFMEEVLEAEDSVVDSAEEDLVVPIEVEDLGVVPPLEEQVQQE